MDSEHIAKFIEVTGESETVARQYLSLADGNVDVAISLMFEGGGQPPEPEPVAEVRPPILPTREILVPSEPDYSFPRLSNNVFDRFRDFAVEAQLQEEEMTRKSTGVKHLSQRKSKRLEDLFRPPCNILFLGSFMEAREHAKGLNRWLLVNIQNPQEFSCQVLNRDIWPNQQIQEIIKDHFVLWQVLSNTSDGKRYIDFYNVVEYPYLAIIDPRTGECMQTYTHITVDILISALNDMLSTHASPESAPHDINNFKPWVESTAAKTVSTSDINNSDCSSSAKSSKYFDSNRNDSDACTASSTVAGNSFKAMHKRQKMEQPEISEEAEGISAKDNVRQDSTESDADQTSTGNELSIRLGLRLPNGKKETIFMCASDTIQDFLNKMDGMGYPSSNHTFLVPFPKTNIGELPSSTQLSDTILSPANTLFITKIQ